MEDILKYIEKLIESARKHNLRVVFVSKSTFDDITYDQTTEVIRKLESDGYIIEPVLLSDSFFTSFYQKQRVAGFNIKW